MAKKSYSERNLKFETLQLHVGQEQPDPVTDARAVPIYLYSITASMLLTDLVLRMQVTSTDVLLIQLKMYLKKELRHLKVV